MTSKVQSPFDGKPTTTEFKDDDGRSTYTVALKAMTPLRARIAHWLSLLAGIAVAICAVRLAFQLGGLDWYEAAALLVSPILAYWAMRFWLYYAMQRCVRVVFTPEQFQIERLFSIKRYDRNLPHGFALYHHDRAGREEEVASFRERRRNGWWQLFPPKRYLGNSYHLSFQYLDQRNIIMTVYRHKHAQRLLARLNAIKRILETEAKGIDEVQSPQRDWTAQPGELSGSTL